jgi:hypothetical protein
MKYNGHKNWNHWNVSLWLFNDEPLYRLMCDIVACSDTLDEAARDLAHIVKGNNFMKAYGRYYTGASVEDPSPATPDGAPYTFTSIRAALVGWEN